MGTRIPYMGFFLTPSPAPEEKTIFSRPFPSLPEKKTFPQKTFYMRKLRATILHGKIKGKIIDIFFNFIQENPCKSFSLGKPMEKCGKICNLN